MATFTPGNIVVYRVGDGTAALTNASTLVFLDEINPATGQVVQSIALPAADAGTNQTLTASGSATSEGLLTRSADGQYLLITGYDQAPGMAAVNGTATTATTRVIGRVSADGSINTTTTTTAFSANNIRGATSSNGTAVYSVGANTGVVLETIGDTGPGTVVSSTVTNIREVATYGGNLYFSTGSGTRGIYQVGVGLPTATGTVATNIISTGTASSPYAFYFADLTAAVAGVDTLYVVDDATDANGGGLSKYSLVNNAWTLDQRIGTLQGRGLTASVSGTTVTLFETTTANAIVTLTDTGGYHTAFSATVPTTIATAGTNTAFRGVALAPQVVAPADTTPPTLASSTPVDNATNVAVDANVVLTFSEAVKAGSGNIVLHPASGADLTIAVTDATQVTFNGTQVTINPTANLQPGVAYDVIIASGVITDSASNAFAGIATDALDFTTVATVPVDTTPPTLSASSPVDNATDVAIGANIALTFGETVAAGAGNIILRPATGADITIAVTDATQVTFAGNQVTINPTADLRAGVAYDVIVASGVIVDTANNPFAGIAQDALDFTTSFTIPAGSQATTFTVADPGSFTLAAGATRTQTAGVGVTVTSATGAAVAIQGTLTDTASGQRAVDVTNAVASGSLTVGAAGVVQSLNQDTVRVATANGKVDLTNLGQILATATAFTPAVGGTNPGTEFAITYNAALGATGAAATDYTSGGVITNGSATITGALIRSDNGDAVRLGSHETLINYGTINGNGPINDAATNNTLRVPATATTQTYDVSRGVRLNQNNETAVRIENYGTITGAQHGVDMGQTSITNVVVTNYSGGQIIGRNGSGVGADTTGVAATTVTVINSGLIEGDRAATVYDRAGYAYSNAAGSTTPGDSDGDGVDIDGGATITNNAGGRIIGNGASGFDSGGRANASEGISIGGGVIVNSGAITGADAGIVVNNDAVASRSGVLATQITNNAGATITGTASYAIRLENKTGNATTDNDAIVNYGTIVGNGTIPVATGAATLENNTRDPNSVGTLDGVTYTTTSTDNGRFVRGDGAAIQTGEGVDTLANYGVITGNSGRAINLEGGADTLTLFTGSTVTGRIDGGAGTDTLTLRLDDRPANGGAAGNNSGATTGMLANVVNVETLDVASGTWTIADAQGYSAGTTVETGAALVLGTGAALTGAVTDNGRLTANSSGTVALAGVISGTGVVQQAGTGTLTLGAANSYSGGTTLTAGTLDLAVVGAAGSGGIAFTNGAQTLRIESAALTAGVFAPALAGFASDGDTIDVRGIGTAATASYNATTGVLTLAGTTNAQVTIGGGYGAFVFNTASDGVDGTAVTITGAPPTLSIGNATVIEGDNGTTNLVFTVTASVASANPITFHAASADGSATLADGDYTALNGDFTIAAGATSATVTVAVTGDARVEGDETLSVVLSAPTNATIATGTGTGTITNDDLASLTISDPTVAEGNGGGTVLHYVVTASAPAPAGGISFAIATADGTATAGTDYVARADTGTIAAGQTTYSFDVAVTGDTVSESAETVLVNLSNPVGAKIADAQGVGTITNDDGAPTGLQPYFTTNFTGFTAAGFAPTPTAAQLDSDVWRVVGLSDNPNPAYGGTYTTGDFARGVITGAADPVTAGVYSPSANGALVIQPTGAELESGGIIEAQLVNTTGFAATSFDVAFDWAFRNSGDRASNLAFSYSTDGTNFTALANDAFTTPGAKDTPAPASFSLQGEVATINNVLVGNGDSLYLRWTHVASSGGGNRDEVGIDNLVVRANVADIQTASAADITIAEGTGGTTNATFTVTRSSGTGAASIGYATADGTALAGRDYTAASGTVTFAEGERSKTVTVAVNPDSFNEANETFFLNLTNPQGLSITDAQARATISNDDTGAVAIYDIQGAAHASPFAGQVVTTMGVITAINANSYWIQDQVGDGLFGTSDALQVFVGAAPTGVLVGDRVTVSGTISEFLPTTGALTVTELTAPTLVQVEHGFALPTAVVIGTDGILPPTNVIDDDGLKSYDPTTDGIDFYESLEGMLVTIEAPIVVGPSVGKTTYVVASGGQGATNVNERGGITLTGDDAAPERIQIFADSTLLPGYTPNHTLGDVLGNVTGVFTYFTYYEVLPTQAVTTITDRTTTREQTALRPDADHLQIVSFNVENLAPVPDSTVADRNTQAKVDDAFATHAREIVSALNTPDIIGLQEIQDADGIGKNPDHSGLATANKLIAAIQAAGGPTYSYVEIAPTDGQSTGGEPDGYIHNGYLYNAARVGYVADSATLIQGDAYTGTRRPLVANFTFNGQTVTVVDQHSTSRGGSDLSFGANQPPAQLGDAARTAQAQGIKTYVDGLQAANPDAKVVVVGDFNGYYYEPALSTLTNDGKLTNLYTLLPVAERYSYLFDGAVQAFDNVVVTNNLLGNAQFDVVHYNSEQTSGRATDHDQAVASLYIPGANTAPTDLTIDNAKVPENAAAGTLVGTITGTDAQGGALTYTLTDDAGGRFAVDPATGRLTTTQPFDYEAIQGATVTASVTDAGGLSYTEQLAIAVTNVNEAPTALTLSAATVAENAPAGTVVGTLAGTDPDAGGALTYSLTENSGGRFAVDAATGQVTTTQPLDYETLQSVQITGRVTDQGGLAIDKAFAIAVTNVNEAPTALTLSGSTVAENAAAGTLIGTAKGTDPEGDALRYTLLNNVAGLFAIDATTGRLTTTAPLNYEAAASQAVTIRATDAGGLVFDQAVTIAVTDVNEAPGATAISSATVTENAAGGTVIGTLTAIDPDKGDTLAFSLGAADTRFRLNGNQLVVAAGAVIDYEVERTIAVAVTATDHAGLSTATTLTLAVQDVAENYTGTAGNDTITGDAGVNTISGGAGDDIINAGGGNDIVDGGDGNDIINGGAGADRITLGAGADTVRGLLSELLGDTIVDFTAADRIVVQRSDLHRADFTVAGTGTATAITFASGTVGLTAGTAGGDLMVAHSGTDSIITYNGYLASLTEGKSVDTAAINGIINQPYLTGDTSTSFTVKVEAISGAKYSNSLGVYEIDTATGAISDVRIVAVNVKTAGGAISVTGVDVGHQLGFFIVQDGANTLSSAVLQSSSLSLINDGGHLVLANGGTAVSGATTFFSHSTAANLDGAAHVLSGVAADGSGDLRIGFEDLVRSGSTSDNDFQDVVLTVEAVPMAHALAAIPGADALATVPVLHG